MMPASSSWQTVNIGDIAHTPGVLALLEKHLPHAEIRLWPSKVDESTQEEKEFKTGEREWKVISWTANHKEWGEASVGFLFSEVGGGKVLTVTYWISKKDSDKSMATLEKIFSSVKSVN